MLIELYWKLGAVGRLKGGWLTREAFEGGFRGRLSREAFEGGFRGRPSREAFEGGFEGKGKAFTDTRSRLCSLLGIAVGCRGWAQL
jgi:hypothetical protein